MFVIRAFRAVDFPDVCEKYIEGHRRVLLSVGVTEVTSAKHDWVHNPNAIVVLCQDELGEKVYGGARIHIEHPDYELPMVEATKDMDSKIIDLVKKYTDVGTGEFCGLWNSLEVAGMGIGAIYLIRACVAIIPKLNLKTLFALCSPFTTRIAGRYSFFLDKSVGNEGTFYYPKLNLVASVVLLKDSYALDGAEENEKEIVLGLRKEPNQIRIEEHKGKTAEVRYELDVKGF
jgi:hypothetical protein